jgi:hypothetical protein
MGYGRGLQTVCAFDEPEVIQHIAKNLDLHTCPRFIFLSVMSELSDREKIQRQVELGS